MSITQTTLSVAIPAVTATSPATSAPQVGTPAGTIITPASMTGIVAPGPNKSNRIILWIGREAFEVVAVGPQGTTATYAIAHRGALGTLRSAGAHPAGVPVWVGKEADFQYFMQNENSEAGLGLYSRFALPFFTLNADTAEVGTVTLTVAALLGGLIQGTPTGAATYTSPTATAIINALAEVSNPYIGQSFEFTILNTSAGANTITFAGGTGVTLVGGTLTIAQNAARKFIAVVTSVTSPAITIYQAS